MSHLRAVQVWLYQGYRSGDLKQLVDTAVNQRAEIRLIPVAVSAAALLAFGVWWATARRPVYMVDFTVYKAPDHLKLTKERFYQGSRDCGVCGCNQFNFEHFNHIRIGENTCSWKLQRSLYRSKE